MPIILVIFLRFLFLLVAYAFGYVFYSRVTSGAEMKGGGKGALPLSCGFGALFFFGIEVWRLMVDPPEANGVAVLWGYPLANPWALVAVLTPTVAAWWHFNNHQGRRFRAIEIEIRIFRASGDTLADYDKIESAIREVVAMRGLLPLISPWRYRKVLESLKREQEALALEYPVAAARKSLDQTQRAEALRLVKQWDATSLEVVLLAMDISGKELEAMNVLEKHVPTGVTPPQRELLLTEAAALVFDRNSDKPEVRDLAAKLLGAPAHKRRLLSLQTRHRATTAGHVSSDSNNNVWSGPSPLSHEQNG